MQFLQDRYQLIEVEVLYDNKMLKRNYFSVQIIVFCCILHLYHSDVLIAPSINLT